LVASSGEILIKLNWSTLSGLSGPPTTTIAIAAAQALLATNLIPALGGRSLVEMPLHLVGHSRGASVVAEVFRRRATGASYTDLAGCLFPLQIFYNLPSARTSMIANIL
jgi:hypothetical protein